MVILNLYKGNNFLIKELFIKPKGILSLQKHFHRSEHWVITKGNPKIVLNKKFYFKKKKMIQFLFLKEQFIEFKIQIKN